MFFFFLTHAIFILTHAPTYPRNPHNLADSTIKYLARCGVHTQSKVLQIMNEDHLGVGLFFHSEVIFVAIWNLLKKKFQPMSTHP